MQLFSAFFFLSHRQQHIEYQLQVSMGTSDDFQIKLENTQMQYPP
jgi:hypothetical protein